MPRASAAAGEPVLGSGVSAGSTKTGAELTATVAAPGTEKVAGATGTWGWTGWIGLTGCVGCVGCVGSVGSVGAVGWVG